MDIKNFQLGQDLGETLNFFQNYGDFIWKQGRTYTHIFARQIYNDVTPFLTQEDLVGIRDALLKLNPHGIDWISRGKFVGYLLYQQKQMNNPKEFSQLANCYCKKRLDFYTDPNKI